MNNHGNIHKKFLGNLPVFKDGINHSRLDRTAASLLANLSKDEISKAYNNWIQIFRIPESTLTFEQYLKKLDEATIGPYNVGNERNQYHLSRYNDEGPYTKESCRFIPKHENLAEQKKEPIYYKVLRKYGPEQTKKMQSINGRLGAEVARKNKIAREKH